MFAQKKWILFVTLTLFTLGASAQTTGSTGKFTVGLSGMVGVAHFKETTALTFGGPQVAAQMGDIKLAASFYPSLVRSEIFDHESRPALGFGGEVQYKNVVLFVPTYYLGDKYRTVVGLGYKF